MAEEIIFAQILIGMSHFECDTDTAVRLRSGVFQLQYDLRIKILIFTVGRTIFLLTAQIA